MVIIVSKPFDKEFVEIKTCSFKFKILIFKLQMFSLELIFFTFIFFYFYVVFEHIRKHLKSFMEIINTYNFKSFNLFFSNIIVSTNKRKFLRCMDKPLYLIVHLRILFEETHQIFSMLLFALEFEQVVHVINIHRALQFMKHC